MSGADLTGQPTPVELEKTVTRFIKYLQAQNVVGGTAGSKVSVKFLRNIYNQKFKYALSNSALGLRTPIVDPIIGFEPVWEFALQNGYIEIRAKTFFFPKLGVTAQREDVNIASSAVATQPKNGPPKKIPVHPKMLHFVATRFQSGFERNLVGQTLDFVRPVLLYTMDTELTYDRPIKELQFGGYQIFRQLMPGRGGIMVYVNKACEATYLEELQSDYFESIWLKLHHPDPVVLEPTAESFETYRPLTIVGCIRGGKNENLKTGTLTYVANCIKKLLEHYPDADVMVFGDYPSDTKVTLDPELKMKSKFVKTSTATPEIFITQWKCQREEVKIGWQKPLASPHDSQIFCFMSQFRHLCTCCQISFLKEEDLHEHRATYKHKKNFQAYVYQNNRSCELSKKYNLFLDIILPDDGSSMADSVSTSNDGTIVWKVEPGCINELIIGLRNGDDPAKQKKDSKGRDLGIVLRSVEFLKHDLDFEMSDKYGFTKPYDDRPLNVKPGIRIFNGQSLKINLRVHKNEPGQFLAPIFVIFGKDGFDESAYMIKEILVKVSNEDVEHLQPSSVFVQPPRLTGKQWTHVGETVPGLKLDKSDNDSKMFVKASRKLDHYLLKPTLEKLLNRGFAQFAGMDTVLEAMWRKYRTLLDSDLSKNNYKERFALLLSCEEHQMQLDIRNYDMEKVTMAEHGPHLLSLEVPGLAENRPSVLKGDRIYVRVYGSAANAEPEKKEYEGIVHEAQNTSLLVGFSQDLRKRFLPKMAFDVRFTFNRFPIRNMHRAVDIIGREAGSFWWNMLFPDDKTALKRNVTSKPIPSFYNKKIEDNAEQRLAVERIVDGGIPGFPYIIFGPPGTGKTVTMVEAIKQVWRNHPDSHVLAAAPSNAAADLLATRLLEHIPKTQLLRIYAPSRNERDVPEKLKSASNFINPANSVKTLMEYRVLVVTLVTAGRMASADLPENHFTHVFIDEAGHAMEPEAVIAVAGIFSGNGHGQLILAGDPKQLGPILRSPIALKFGLQLSLLERLMANPVYGRDNSKTSYNSNCITKLLSNFRSHPKLLELPSKLFYDSELKPMAELILTGSLLKWEGLAKQGFPMIFHGVVGEDKREARSPSFFNAEEAVIVVNYVEKLLTNKQKVLPSEIGIISPYRRQVQKLRDLMNRKFRNRIKNWQDITVGSTEEFQGQERRVIIISTVRSQPELIRADFVHKLGFLRNPKRFNVAITRAKALLIVVGNPFLLCMDYHWKQLIQFTKENGGYTGVKFVLSDSISDSPELTQMEEKFRRMGLLSDNDNDLSSPDLEQNVLGDISVKEYVEGQEWRAEI